MSDEKPDFKDPKRDWSVETIKSLEERLEKLEAKFKIITKLIEQQVIDLPRLSLNQYLEDKTK